MSHTSEFEKWEDTEGDFPETGVWLEPFAAKRVTPAPEANAQLTLQQTLAEAQELLAEQVWQPNQRAYLQGKLVRIVLDPVPEAALEPRFSMPITIFPLRCNLADLKGVSVLLRSAGVTRWGCLNQRGQIRFRDLAPDTYQITVQRQRTGAGRAALPRQDTTMGASATTAASATSAAPVSGKRYWKQVFRNAAGWLTATAVERRSGELYLYFEARDRAWDGTVVCFAWQPQPDGPSTLEAAEEAPLSPLLAVLAWDDLEGYEGCVAEVRLGWARQFSLELPDEPVPLAALTGELARAIAPSLERAATDHSRHAWKQLLTEDTLPAEARALLKEAVQKSS